MAMENKKLGIILGVVVGVVAAAIMVAMLLGSSPDNTANNNALLVAQKIQSGEQLSCDFDQLIGEPASKAVEFVAQQGRKVRMVKEGSPVTMDYRAERVTISHDDNQIVTHISCG